MNCQEVVELIQRYMDLDLAKEEEQVLLNHLKECPECASLFETYKLLSNGLESLPKVTPPYSIVNAIMPKLREMGLYPEESAAMEPADGLRRSVPRQGRNSGVPDAKGQKLRGLVSWRFALGGIAAGIALGVFLFSQNGAELQRRADGELPPSKSGKTSDSTPGGGQNSVNTKPGSSAQPDINGNTGGTAGGQPGQLAGPNGASAGTPKSGEPSSAGETQQFAGNNTAAPGAGLGASPNASDPGKSLSVQQPSTLPEAESRTKLPHTSASPRSTADGSAKAAPKPTPEPTPNHAVTPPPRTFDVKTPAPSKEEPVYGIRSFVLPIPTPAPAVNGPQLASPSGTYIAVVKDQTVVVTDKNGNEVYRSGIRWKNDDAVRLTGWPDNSKLSYTVKSADGTEGSYTIDTAAGTETKN